MNKVRSESKSLHMNELLRVPEAQKVQKYLQCRSYTVDEDNEDIAFTDYETEIEVSFLCSNSLYCIMRDENLLLYPVLIYNNIIVHKSTITFNLCRNLHRQQSKLKMFVVWKRNLMYHRLHAVVYKRKS